MLLHHNKLIKKTISINTDFRLRDTINDKLIGLRNFGATCYLNSLIQQLFMTPTFNRDLFKFNINENENLKENSVIYNMQIVFANLKYSCMTVYPPYKFIKSFKKAFNGEPIQYGVQQDSDEFLAILCDHLENESKKYGNNNFLENSFKGKIANEIVSLEKEFPYYSQSDEDFYRVTLDIKGHKSLEEALDAYVKGEILDGENQYYVEKYKKKISIRKSSSLKKLGNQIIIHLKRFEFDFVTFTNKKLNDYLTFPLELNFKKWTRAFLRTTDPNLKSDIFNITEEEKQNLNNEKMEYVLTGILIHSGSNLQSGHYYSLIMDQENGKWHVFNDNNIGIFDIEKDLAKECFGNPPDKSSSFGRGAYLLFYTKKECFRNQNIINEIKISENILNDVRDENSNYLEIKTYTSGMYQEFLQKFVNISLNNPDLNNNSETDLENKNIINSMNKNQKLNIKIFEHIYKDNNGNINLDDIEDLINKYKNEFSNNNDKSNNKYSKKNIIKLLFYYIFNIVNQHFNENIRISSTLEILNKTLSNHSNNYYELRSSLSLLKVIEKNTEFFLEIIFKCGSKSQDMIKINKEIYDLFTALFQNVYNYEKKFFNNKLNNKFSYFAKNDQEKRYTILQEYESCLLRFIQKFFCNNLEKCRKEFALDQMFLHLFKYCTDNFPEISHVCVNYLVKLISFITNNSLKNFKSEENPNFIMGGNFNYSVNFNYTNIFSNIILSSVTEGMLISKEYSPCFKGDKNNNMEFYAKLPDDLNIIYSMEFFINYLYSYNYSDRVIVHLSYKDENNSVQILSAVNKFLKQKNIRIEQMENILIKLSNVFNIIDGLEMKRMEIFFELNQANDNNLFTYLYEERYSEFVLCIIYNFALILEKYEIVYNYFLENKNKLMWLDNYIQELKIDGFMNDYFSRANSRHQNILFIIENNLIERLGLNVQENPAPVGNDNNNEEQNGGGFNDSDDDDGFNLI